MVYQTVCMLCFGYIGSQAVMVCQTLASIAVHTPGTWNHVSPKLLDYLDSKLEDSYKLLVSWFPLIRTVYTMCGNLK